MGCSNPLGTSNIVDKQSTVSNTVPTLSSVSNQIIIENTSTASLVVTIGDAENILDCNTSLSISSTNSSLIDNSNVVYSGTAPSCSFIITPKSNEIGSSTITLIVNDTSLTTQIDFELTVSRALVLDTGSYKFSNGNYASNCKEYIDSSFYNNEGDGTYWVDPDGAGTIAAFPIYCDMTTSAGGWALIGRGREGWAWSNSGLRESLTHQNIGTTSAFTPAYYSNTKVTALLNGLDVNSLVDGVRLKRAITTDGSSYQDYRWFFTSQITWSWLFDTSLSIFKFSLNGTDFCGGNTRDNQCAGNNDRRVFTWAWGNHASKRGFAYGATVNIGTNSLTNFLWENGSENHSIPYTEVYIRE
jgi:hypothetical protein